MSFLPSFAFRQQVCTTQSTRIHTHLLLCMNICAVAFLTTQSSMSMTTMPLILRCVFPWCLAFVVFLVFVWDRDVCSFLFSLFSRYALSTVLCLCMCVFICSFYCENLCDTRLLDSFILLAAASVSRALATALCNRNNLFILHSSEFFRRFTSMVCHDMCVRTYITYAVSFKHIRMLFFV